MKVLKYNGYPCAEVEMLVSGYFSDILTVASYAGFRTRTSKLTTS